MTPAPVATPESVPQAVRSVIDTAVQLAKKEIELARLEAKADLKSEIGMVKGLGIAGVCALMTLAMLLVACAFALSHVMADWLAALVVAGIVLAIGTVAGLIGWGKRVRDPLAATRKTLKEDAQWVKERIT